MSGPATSLIDALRDRYLVERELGRGGMATVYLAHDVKHDRQIALKVMHPEIAAVLGPERFLREIRLTARLQHPHILPLFDSGEAGGRLWYVMPYVEGESLRERLIREGELPIAEALRILREVADALAYAHAAGLVHRDIKPANVLLAGTHAFVADFGVAKAVSAAAEAENLTSAGLALGTPTYMAPEQATGDPNVDGRADLYALGVVAYEMLIGTPPFVARSPQALLGAHATQSPEPIGSRRPTVPTPLAALVMRLLEKRPADRPQTAAEVLRELETAMTPSGVTAAPRVAKRLPGRAVAIGLGAALLAVAGLKIALSRPLRAGGSDPSVVAIAPFRISGADPSLGYLREGMVDLLAAKLTDKSGRRAADPRMVLSAWRRAGGSEHEDLPEEAMLRLATRVGAGRLLFGAVVGTPSRLVLDASLVAVRSDRVRATAEVVGPADSLPTLIDGLAAQLLAREAGEGERLSELTSTSLPALRFFLDGQAAYRRGLYSEAVHDFDHALQLDSSFALAGLGLAAAADWTEGQREEVDRGLRLAWAARGRLGPRDLARLIAYTGPRYPAPSSMTEAMAACQRAVDAAPDRPEPWYDLGEAYFHFGPGLGMPDAHRRSTAALDRALELDSAFTTPLVHLVDLAVLAGDTARARRLVALYFARDSVSDVADFLRWRVALALGDSTALATLRARFDRMALGGLLRIIGTAQVDGIALNDAERAARTLRQRVGTGTERRAAYRFGGILALNQGRIREGLDLLAQQVHELPEQNVLLAVGPGLRPAAALYWDADTADAGRTAREMERSATETPRGTRSGMMQQFAAICLSQQWRLAHGETTTARRSLTALRALRSMPGASVVIGDPEICIGIIEAWLAESGGPSASGALDRLDSLARTGPQGVGADVMNLVVARLRERQGDLRSALAAVRRRPYHWIADGTVFLSTSFREEGRLAALTGDHEGAVRAYRHYLALRSDPDPALRAQVEQVRAELAKLLGQIREP
jgi:serine/threonine-protein kinase